MLPNSFYKASIILITNSDKDITKKENCRPIPVMNTDAKFSTKYQQTRFNDTLKRYTSWSSEIYPRNARLTQHP